MKHRYRTRAKDKRYIIIGGQPKAGTTTLYDWLSSHPQVVPSKLKETRFFLDFSYPLKRRFTYNGANLDQYLRLFPKEEYGQFLMESTPDYLYSTTAIRILELLPHSWIIFILRDPVDRVVSWFKFARQRGMLSAQTTFELYLEQMINMQLKPDTPVHYRALEQCKVYKYLPAFLETAPQRCLILDFNDLVHNPQVVLDKVATFTGLEKTRLAESQLCASNSSLSPATNIMQKTYYRLRSHISYTLNPSPSLKYIIKPLNSSLKKILFRNSTKAQAVEISDACRNLITEYAGDWRTFLS